MESEQRATVSIELVVKSLINGNHEQKYSASMSDEDPARSLIHETGWLIADAVKATADPALIVLAVAVAQLEEHAQRPPNKYTRLLEEKFVNAAVELRRAWDDPKPRTS